MRDSWSNHTIWPAMLLVLAVICGGLQGAELRAQTTVLPQLPITRLAHGRHVPWPVESQTATSIDDWLQIKADARPQADQLVIPRLYHVVRHVVVSQASDPTLWVTVDVRPELTEWRIVVPDELKSVKAIQVWLQLDSAFNGRLLPAKIQPAANGSIVLPAREATTYGSKLRFEPQTYKDTVGYWTQAADSAAWQFETTQAGDYHVEVLQGCGSGMGGSRVACEIGDRTVEFKVVETGHFQRFIWRRVGAVELPVSDSLQLRLKAIDKRHAAVADFRQIRLVPAETRKTDGDIRAVSPDLIVPALTNGAPRPGRRVRISCKSFPSPHVFASLYLPVNWQKGKSYPVIVELPGNGGYRNAFGDACTGEVGDASFGYGITGGQDAIWLVVPFLDESGSNTAETWWGDPPHYQTKTSLGMLSEAVEQVCEQWGGDAGRVVLTGFSRGSLACNYLGLANNQISPRWRAFVCYSHYDGVEHGWPYPADDVEAAMARLNRLGRRQQFVCMEDGSMLERIRSYLGSTPESNRIVVRSTGFRNHSDRWALRPSPARKELRTWLQQQLE